MRGDCVCTICGMNVADIRHENLCWLLKHQFNGVQARLAVAVGRDPNQVRVLLRPQGPGGRWMGEKVARDIERRLGLPANRMDVLNGVTGSFDASLTPAQLQLKESVDRCLSQLCDDDARAVARFIEAMATRG